MNGWSFNYRIAKLLNILKGTVTQTMLAFQNQSKSSSGKHDCRRKAKLTEMGCGIAKCIVYKSNRTISEKSNSKIELPPGFSIWDLFNQNMFSIYVTR